MEKDKSQIPPPDKFCFETPLYSTFLITIDNFHNIHLLETYGGPAKHFCPECNHETVYKSEFRETQDVITGTGHVLFGDHLPKKQSNGERLRQKELQFLVASSNRKFDVELVCSMNPKHKIIFQFYINKEKISKVGQYPSVYDLGSDQLKKYKSNLKNYHEELCKSVKLNASGIGIGAYVYLRRIFEKLVFETFMENLDVLGGISESDFLHTDMKERIKILKDFLPTFLVDNSILYGILSKGIHELDEVECLNYFDLMKECIFMILDQKMEEERKKEKSKKLNEALQKAANKISGK